MREQAPPRGRIPKAMTPEERMERKLLTKRGREIYGKRGQTVEPVFGQIKDVRKSDRFMRRVEAPLYDPQPAKAMAEECPNKAKRAEKEADLDVKEEKKQL